MDIKFQMFTMSVILFVKKSPLESEKSNFV